MIDIELLFGSLNLLIYLPIIYFTRQIVRHLSEDADVASAMFFLKEDAGKTFKVSALMVAFVLAGEVMIYASHFYGQFYRGLGYGVVTIASLGVLYWVRVLSGVTSNPSESKGE